MIKFTFIALLALFATSESQAKPCFWNEGDGINNYSYCVEGLHRNPNYNTKESCEAYCKAKYHRNGDDSDSE